jgi:hypothetical protein
MHLTEDDSQFQDYLDGRLPAPEAQLIQAHLEGCRGCRALVEEWQKLDLELSHHLPHPALSSEFYARLHDRIELDPLAPSSETDKKRRIENQYDAVWKALRKSFFRGQFPALLDGVGYSTLAAVGAYLLFHLLLNLLHAHFKSLPLSQNQMELGVLSIVSLIFLLAGFGVAARKQLAAWAEELSA